MLYWLVMLVYTGFSNTKLQEQKEEIKLTQSRVLKVLTGSLTQAKKEDVHHDAAPPDGTVPNRRESKAKSLVTLAEKRAG